MESHKGKKKSKSSHFKNPDKRAVSTHHQATVWTGDNHKMRQKEWKNKNGRSNAPLKEARRKTLSEGLGEGKDRDGGSARISRKVTTVLAGLSKASGQHFRHILKALKTGSITLMERTGGGGCSGNLLEAENGERIERQRVHTERLACKMRRWTAVVSIPRKCKKKLGGAWWEGRGDVLLDDA